MTTKYRNLLRERSTYQTRKFLLDSDYQRDTAIAVLRNVPIDPGYPLECLIREEVKARKPDQNSLMWAGALSDIAEQGYVKGRTYSAEVWHEFFKREFLPEEFDQEQCKEGYRKWDYTPDGERVMVGSTKKLTVRGFAIYLTQVEAYGASLGVRFHANPKACAAWMEAA